MINPDLVNTIRVGELPSEPFNLTDNIPHEIGTDLKRGTVQQLADFIATVINVSGGVGFRAVSVSDGQTLPETTTQEFILVGKGTYFNVGGGDTIVLTEELNALVSNGSFWFVGVEIPIDVELAGITQEIREGFLKTAPSENTVFNAITNLDIQDVIDAPTFALLPPVGVARKIYITLDTNLLYRFDGVNYIPLSADVSGKEDKINKTDSFITNSSTTYSSSRALFDGLATKVSSTATTNFIPKVNAGGNLENSIVSQPVANRVDVAGAINISTNNLISFGGVTGLFPGIGKLNISNALIAVKADNSDFVPLGYSQGNATMGYRTGSNGGYSFINIGGNPLQTGVVDTGLTRIGAGRIGVGNGNVGNITGQIIAAKGLFNTSTDDGVNVGIFNGTISVATATQPNQAPRLEQVIQTTGNQTATGRKQFNSDNTTAGGITVSNNKTTGGADAIGLSIFNSGTRGLNIEASGGVGARFYGGTTATEALVVTKSDATTGVFLSDLFVTDTGDFIKVDGKNTGGQFTFLNRFGVASARAGTANNNLATLGQIKSRDGWASYSTTTFTNASPFTVAPNTTVTLPNNANNSITTDLPLGVTAFYNGTTNKITPAAIGDAYTVNVRFKARTTMNNDYLTLFIDIGAGTQINAEAKQFLKGANTEQPFSFTMPIFTLATFVANGGEIKVSSNSGTISIYDVTFYINRNYTRQ